MMGDRDPMTRGSQVIGARLFNKRSDKYHALPVHSASNRITLCGCLPSIRLTGRPPIHCGRRARKEPRFNRYFATRSIWSS